MESFLHIISRFALHVVASSFLYLCSFFLVRWLLRRHELLARLALPAVVVFAGTTLREAYDVAQGQLLIKAFTDYISWIVGLGLTAYAVYRIVRPNKWD